MRAFFSFLGMDAWLNGVLCGTISVAAISYLENKKKDLDYVPIRIKPSGTRPGARPRDRDRADTQ
jgi:hypothetical protein